MAEMRNTTTQSTLLSKAPHFILRVLTDPLLSKLPQLWININKFQSCAKLDDGKHSYTCTASLLAYLSPSFFFSFCFLRTISKFLSFHVLFRNLMGLLPTYLPASIQKKKKHRQSHMVKLCKINHNT